MKENATDITIVLDRSGSMESVRTDSIGGFNTFIEEQKAVPGEATLTLHVFNEDHFTLYDAVSLDGVPPLTRLSYIPNGYTALLDAMGQGMLKTGERLAAMPEVLRPQKVLFVVMTDGLENSSKRFRRDEVAGMIQHQREVYSWQIVFIGANQDAIATAKDFGIPKSNAMTYDHTPEGTQRAVRRLSESTTKYRSSGGAATAGFLEDADSK